MGVDDRKQVNQMANYALLEWPENIDISDEAPAVYVPEVRKRFDDATWTTMHELHALPLGWENMPYDAFLNERRKLMADIIRRGMGL